MNSTAGVFLRGMIPACILLLSIGSCARAQPGGSGRGGRPGPMMMHDDWLFIEPAVFPSDSSGIARASLLVRVKSDMLLFVRTGLSHPDSAYRGGLQFSVEVLDRSGKPVAHRDKSVAVYVSEKVKQENRIADRLFSLAFPLAPGAYRAECAISVDESQIEEKRMVPIRVRETGGAGPRIFAAVPIAGEEPGAMRALAYGGGIPYTMKSLFLVALQADSGAVLSASFLRNEASPRVLRKIPAAVARGDSSLSIGFRSSSARDPRLQLWVVELSTDTLQFGMHSLLLALRQGEISDTLRQPMPVVWEGRPRCLSFLSYAVSAMRYILTEDQLDEMSDGEPCDGALRFIGGALSVMRYMTDGEVVPPERGEPCAEAEKFFAFWKKMDPTPGTIWNERMVEYFRRVDEAREAYRSVIENDGVFTARGRIHILYGPPEETSRSFSSSGAPLETWLYPSLRKRFVFIDRGRNGGYELNEEGTL